MGLAVDPLGQSFANYIRDVVIPMKGGKLCVNDKNVFVEGEPYALSIKRIVSLILTESDSFDTHRQQDAVEPLEPLLVKVPGPSFYMFDFVITRTCKNQNCGYTFRDDRSQNETGILHVPIPATCPMQFDLKDALKYVFEGDPSLRHELRCDSCHRRSIQEGQILTSAPEFLILHLVRFTSDLQKLTQECIPLQEIDIPVYGDTHVVHRYKLTCIVEHRGEEYAAGHYVTYVRLHDSWLEVDDSDLYYVNAHQLTWQPYILIYHRQE